MKQQFNSLARQQKIKTPFYYYVAGALALSTLEVFLDHALNVSLGWLSRSVMMMFFVFYLPRALAAKRKINK